MEKPKGLIVKITLDDSEFKSKLNDIEKQFDRIIEKQKQIKEKEINDCDSVTNELVKKFPMREKHAEMLIRKYGSALAYSVAYELDRQGFFFSDLDKKNIEDAININPRFRNSIEKIIYLHNEKH